MQRLRAEICRPEVQGQTQPVSDGGKTFKIVNGDISDGYHTFEELYEHRCALFVALLIKSPDISWYSLKHSDGSDWPGWFIDGRNNRKYNLLQQTRAHSGTIPE